MVIALPLLCVVAGLLMWGFAANTKLAEAGKLMYFAGLLAFLLRGADALVKLIP